jgi:hypothetical protein
MRMSRYGVSPNMLVVPPSLLLYLAVGGEEKIASALDQTACCLWEDCCPRMHLSSPLRRSYLTGLQHSRPGRAQQL